MNESPEETINLLLRKADLNLLLFDRNHRTVMEFYGRQFPFYVMSYHKTGTAKLRINQEHVYEIPPKTVILIPPNVLHDHYKDSSENTEFMFWHFTFMIDNVFDVLQFFQIPIIFPLKHYQQFELTFARYLDELKQQKSGYLLGPILEKAKSYELLHFLLQEALNSEEAPTLKPHSHSFLEILVHIFQKPEQPLSLKDLAIDYHMNPTYISNRFKELFGTSPIHLQRQIRMQKAKSLLTSSDLSIMQICLMVGCEELQNFSRLFKTIVGMSPSDYRKISKQIR